MIRKRFHRHWVFECPEAVMTCSILKSIEKSYLAFGGHDKALYLMNDELMIVDDVEFDGWCRCTYPIDIDGDGCDDLLVGTGDNRLLVLKFDKEKQKLIGIMNFKSEGKINCCVAGDFYRDGNIEFIFGGEDKKLFILKDIYSKEPIETFYYDSWITSCSLGFLKLPQLANPIFALLVGTQNGLLQLVQINNNKPDILWQKNIYSQINDIKIGDVTNDGYNEIIVAADDSYIKIYDCEGNRVKFIKIEKDQTKSKSKRHKLLNRPKTLLIQDIDGNNANEIIAGCADGTLRVFQNNNLNSKNYELKWKTKTSSSIRDICSLMDNDENLVHIIFGGYERTLTDITDFEYGKKPILKIPQQFKIPKPLKKTFKEDVKEKKIKTVPTNLRGFIIKLLEKRGFFLTTELLINKLLEEGYERDDIKDEIELMKSQEAVRYGKIDLHVWSINEEIITDLINSEASGWKKKDVDKPKLVEKSEIVEIPEVIMNQLEKHQKESREEVVNEPEKAKKKKKERRKNS